MDLRARNVESEGKSMPVSKPTAPSPSGGAASDGSLLERLRGIKASLQGQFHELESQLEAQINARRLSAQLVHLPRGYKGMVTERQVRNLLTARRQRANYFAPDLFSDPAWEMLLFLLAEHLAGRRVTTSMFSENLNIPATTTLRWISALIEAKMVVTEGDVHDRRRKFVKLTDPTLERLFAYFDEIVAPLDLPTKPR